MADIWINEQHASLKKYSATATGAKSVVKIEIEVNDANALGWLLKELGEIQESQKRRREDAKRSQKAEPLAIAAPPLRLPFIDGGRS